MKWLLHLFALYILLLSGVPCSADDGCCAAEDTTAIYCGQQHSDTEKEPVTACSPFFACGACHGVTVPDAAIELVLIMPPAIRLPYYYIKQSLPDFSSAIWQPPRLV